MSISRRGELTREVLVRQQDKEIRLPSGTPIEVLDFRDIHEFVRKEKLGSTEARRLRLLINTVKSMNARFVIRPAGLKWFAVKSDAICILLLN